MTEKNTMPVRLYGNSPQLESYYGLDCQTSRKLSAIIIYSGSIEYFLERAIWRLMKVEPKGVRPDTDTKSITWLIDEFEELAPEENELHRPHWIYVWCKAARSAATIRNNISHGVAGRIGGVLTFSRNPQWEGEKRKRAFGDFWCNAYQLEYTADAFATLLKMIIQVERNEALLEDIGHEKARQALNEARSILSEFADQNFVP